MKRVKYISAVSLMMIVLYPCLATGDDSTTIGDGSVYGSHRHNNLVNVPERRLWSSVSELGGSTESGLFGRAQVRWGLIDRRLEISERGLEKTRFSLTAHTETGWLGLNVPIAGDWAEFEARSGIASPEKDNIRALYDLHLEASPVEMATVDVRIGNRMEVFDLGGVFWGEQIDVNIPAEWNYSMYEGRIKILPGLTLLAGYRDMALSEPTPDRETDFTSGLSGTAEFRYQGLCVGNEDGSHVRIVSNRLNAGGRLDLFHRGTRFGQVSQIDAEIDWYRIEGRPPIAARYLHLSLDYLTGSIEVAGNIQGWPFTDPLEDLLGIRRNFKGKADVDLWRAAWIGDFQPAKNWLLETQLDLYRLYPDLEFADWMPTFMVFGVQDMDRYQDDYDRIDFGRAQIAVERIFGRIVLGGHISQLFPIELKKSPSIPDTSEGPQGNDISTKPSGPTTHRDGGRSIRLWLGYRL